MDIKWSYALIIVIYILLVILRWINYKNAKAFQSAHKDYEKAFMIKKDFFITVGISCIVVMIAINIASICGHRPLNTSSMIITILVVGLALLNSFSYIVYSQKDDEVMINGYCLTKGDVNTLITKSGKRSCKFILTLNKEIDSYNDIKILVYGQNKEKLEALFRAMITEDKNIIDGEK